MQANFSNALLLRRILEMDLGLWYKGFCCQRLEAPDANIPQPGCWSQHTDSWLTYHDFNTQSLSDMERTLDSVLEERVKKIALPSRGIAHTFAAIVAYLLVLMLKVSL